MLAASHLLLYSGQVSETATKKRAGMINIHTLFLILAAICLALAAFDVKFSRINLGWLGMTFWLLTLIVR